MKLYVEGQDYEYIDRWPLLMRIVDDDDVDRLTMELFENDFKVVVLTISEGDRVLATYNLVPDA